MFSCCLTGATPAVVLVEVETVVSPAQVPFEIAILRFETFAAGALAVKIGPMSILWTQKVELFLSA